MTTTVDPAEARADHDERDRQLDEMLADSFPASDPPSTWAGSNASAERIVLRPYATSTEARVAHGRLDPSVPKRDRFLFQAPADEAAASVATAAGGRSALRGAAATAAVLLVAGLVLAVAEATARTPLGAYAVTVAMVSTPFTVALALFVLTYRRWAGRPVELVGALPARRQPIFLAVRESRSARTSTTAPR
jgi:hypothetical protein